MVIVRLKGGMGNQMFQYAFGKGVAAKLKTQLKVDCALLLDRARGDQVYRDYDLSIFKLSPEYTISPELLRRIFGIKYSVFGRMLRRWVCRGNSYFKERHFHVDHKVLARPQDNTLYDGWWQSSQYFENIAEEIRNDFQFAVPILPESQNLYQEIISSHSVCLNVRRTDFVSNDTLNTTDQSYFLKATEEMVKRIDDPIFFVFSDDVEWCREHLIVEYPCHIVGHEHKGERFGNYLQMMSACKHFIIPNSTFAWWAVWLNRDFEKTVIAPKNWFNDEGIDTTDLVPHDWIRI